MKEVAKEAFEATSVLLREETEDTAKKPQK